MIEHKAYECEFCNKEFDHDEREEAIRYEAECECNSLLKMCSACKYGKHVMSYGREFIQCTQLRPTNRTCDGWATK